MHAGTKKWKRLDYICTTPWVLKFVQPCRVYTEPSKMFQTDHRLLVMNIDFPTTKKSLKLWLLKGKPKEPKVRRNFNVLRDDPVKRQELTERTEEHLETLSMEDTDVDTLNEEIVLAVRTSAEVVCPIEEALKKKEPW